MVKILHMFCEQTLAPEWDPIIQSSESIRIPPIFMLLLLAVGAWEAAFARRIYYGIHEMHSELENNALEYMVCKQLSRH